MSIQSLQEVVYNVCFKHEIFVDLDSSYLGRRSCLRQRRPLLTKSEYQLPTTHRFPAFSTSHVTSSNAPFEQGQALTTLNIDSRSRLDLGSRLVSSQMSVRS